MFKNLYSVYVVLMVAVIFVLSAPAMATNVAHTMVGGVIVTQVTGAKIETTTIDYNVPFPSLDLCDAAIVKVEKAYFSPAAAVSQALLSEGDARKLVHLQCVQRAGVLPVAQ